MKKITRKIVIILICIVVLISPEAVFALNISLDLQLANMVGLFIDSNNALVNGVKAQIDSNNNVKPYIKNNRTLVPARFIAENLNAAVKWNKDEAKVEITYNNKVIYLYIGKNLITVNGKVIENDVCPEIYQDRTFVPLRLVCELLDKKVFWDNGLIIIYGQDKNVDFLKDKTNVNNIVSLIISDSMYPASFNNYVGDNDNMNSSVSLKNVKYWAYQINGDYNEEEITKLVDSKYDLLVLEPTRTVKSSTNYDMASIVRRLKESKASDGKSNKIVIAYIDIAQIEDWRWYYNSVSKLVGNSSLILSSDPEGWGGSFQVKYWKPEWKNIMIYGSSFSTGLNYKSSVEQAMNDGFDGLFLDWVEAYGDNSVKAAALLDGVSPEKEMIKFLSELRVYTKSRNKDSYIIQQNGSSLLDSGSELLNYVDAITQEAVWYDGDGYKWDDSISDIRNSEDETSYYIKNLTKYKDAGKIVFNVEYAEQKAQEVYDLSRKNGFIPYCTRRGLDKLTNTPSY